VNVDYKYINEYKVNIIPEFEKKALCIHIKEHNTKP